MMVRIHATAGAVALVCIAAFWCASLLSEAIGDPATIALVKAAILYGMALLISALAVAGGTGFKLAKGWKGGLVQRKALRMRLAAGNGLLVLVPSAIFLANRSAEGALDVTFYAVQAVELAAGAANFVLLGLNMRDGLALRRRSRSKPGLLPAG